MTRVDILATALFGTLYIGYNLGYIPFEVTVLAILILIGLGLASIEDDIRRGSE